MVSRWVVAFACVYVAMGQLLTGLERLTPGYIPTRWWEAPGWLMVPSAIYWVWVANKVWKGEVR
jgi:hypothetical protein